MPRKNQVPDLHSFGSDRGPAYDPYEHERRKDSGPEYTISGVTFGREEDDYSQEVPRSRMADAAQEDIERGARHRGSHAGKGPKGYRRSDESIREEASLALYRNDEVDASDIEVTVEERCIFLRGNVDSRISKRLAEECVADISGVEDVQNELKIIPGDEDHFRPTLSTDIARDEELKRQKLA